MSMCSKNSADVGCTLPRPCKRRENCLRVAVAAGVDEPDRAAFQIYDVGANGNRPEVICDDGRDGAVCELLSVFERQHRIFHEGVERGGSDSDESRTDTHSDEEASPPLFHCAPILSHHK